MLRSPRRERSDDVWAMKFTGGSWYAPDHFACSRVRDPAKAKPFFGDPGKFYAKTLLRIWSDATIVPHPHPELWW